MPLASDSRMLRAMDELGFPPHRDRPCWGKRSCRLSQEECVCYQETLARTRRMRMTLLTVLLAVAFSVGLWFSLKAFYRL